MARMNCRCGEVLSNSMAPNEIELRVYTDGEWDEIMNADIIEAWKLPLPNRSVWRCPKCKRVYVFEEGNYTPIKVYALE